jgi:quercetin dioxygenase-like cupin family protein
MTAKVRRFSKETSTHYSWGKACDAWTLVERDDVSLKQERMPSQTSEARHRHASMTQIFYVLRGMLTVVVEQDEFTLRTGEGLEIPPGVFHEVKNQSDGEVEFLLVSQPNVM